MYWPKLDELSEDRVTDAHTLIAQMLEEKCPELNARRGVVGDLVVELHAIMQGSSMQAIEDYRRSFSAEVLATEPETALPGAVDALVGNFGVTRRILTKPRGNITVILKKPAGSFSKNVTFMAKDQRFYVDQTIVVRPPGAQMRSRHDVASVELDGGYAVQVPVIAEHMTEQAMLHRFDKLTPEVRPPGFELAYVTDDFIGGAAPQTNAELVRQMRAGIAAPGFSGPENVKALILGSGVSVVDVAVLGAADAEMVRDQREDGISRGGKIDIYLKSRTFPACVGLCKSATLVSKTSTMAVWQVTLERDDAPGFYTVRDIRPTGTDPREPGCQLTEDTRECDTSACDYAPDMLGDDFRYSRYQRTTLRFEEEIDTFGLVVGDTKEFEVSVLYMPGIATVQDYLNGPDARQPGLDVLVRAATPAWMMIDITCKRSNPVSIEEVVTVAEAYINNLAIGDAPNQFTLVNGLEDPGAVLDCRLGGLKDFNATSAPLFSPSKVIINCKD